MKHLSRYMKWLGDVFPAISKYRTLIVTLSALVVFVTTYLLILPVLTLDEDEAEAQGGIDVPQAEQIEGEPDPADEPGTLTRSSKAFTVSIDYGKGSGLTQDTELSAEEILDVKGHKKDFKDYRELALAAVKEKTGKSVDLELARFFDITLEDQDGKIEPSGNVDVFVDLDDQPSVSGDGDFYIIHYTENEKTGKTEAAVLDDKDSGFDVKKNKIRSVRFTADSFSVYGIVYTVDFHWEADGNTYEYSMPGGSVTALGDIVESLGLAQGELQEFMADVDDVQFSDPALVWTGKAADETTAGALKEANGLEPEYSAELTAEQIEEINETKIAAGDWALISLKPFDSEETLTVTMKNGDQWTVMVTDASYGITAVTDLDGAKGALINPVRNNAVQDAPHSQAGRLRAEAVTIDTARNNISTNNPSAQLAEWTFTRVGTSGNNYTIRSDAGYLNINGNNVSVSQNAQNLRVDTNASGQIRIISGEYALNNWWSDTANGYGAYNNLSNTTNPDEWFTLYALGAPNVPHVTVHYVDRNGTVLTGVQYTGSNSDIVDNGDGTFMIPYSTSGSIDLRTQFDFSSVGDEQKEYTYANTHLAGKDASGNDLTYEGYLIDSVLTGANGNMTFKTDTGETNKNFFESDDVLGNLNYGPLKTYSLTGTINARPSNDGSKFVYVASNNKDIYVILDPLPKYDAESAGSGGAMDPAEPTLEKTMESNEDGTYTLSLKVDAHAASVSETNKANVLFVVDTSSSMRQETNPEKTRSRITDTHDAVKKFGEDLLDYNANHGSDAIEVAMITFDGSVDERLDWTTEKDVFTENVDEYLRYKYLHKGTDWEDGLKTALDKIKNDTDDDPTFVVFFTDGEPSQYTNFNGKSYNNNQNPINPGEYSEQVSGGYPNFYSYFLCREGSKDEMRAIVDSGAKLYGVYAYNSTNQYYDGYNGHEDGAKMLHNAIKYGYNTSEDLENELFYEAHGTDDLKDAFDKIFNLITESVGFTNVVVNDGIAAGVTSSTVVDGDVSGFTYIIRNKAGEVVYKVTVAPNGVPEGVSAAEGTPIFTIGNDPPVVGEKKTVATTKIKTDADGQPVTDTNGKIQTEDVDVEVYYYKDADDNEYIMPISTTGENITWDLSPLGVLKDGYSYEVNFVVWPNQEAYDLVADLNNGKRPDLEAATHWETQPIQTDSAGRQYRKGGFTDYPYISRYEDSGIYSAMSNTDQAVDYYKADKKIVNGNEVTEYTGPHNKTVDPPDPMPLTAAYSEIALHAPSAWSSIQMRSGFSSTAFRPVS